MRTSEVVARVAIRLRDWLGGLWLEMTRDRATCPRPGDSCGVLVRRAGETSWVTAAEMRVTVEAVDEVDGAAVHVWFVVREERDASEIRAHVPIDRWVGLRRGRASWGGHV